MKMIRSISANVIGLACGAAITFTIYNFFYLGKNSADEPVSGVQYSIHEYSAIESSNLFGLARVAANKALERNASVKLVYYIDDVCKNINALEQEKTMNGLFSVAKFENGNKKDKLTETFYNLGIPDIEAICMSHYNIDSDENMYVMVSSNDVRRSLEAVNLHYGYVAIGK